MPRRLLLFAAILSVALASPFAPAGDKDKDKDAKNKANKRLALLRQVVNLKTVAIVTYPNEDRFAPVAYEDVRVMDAVETKVRSWKKFLVVANPQGADFVIAVRPGHLVGARIGGSGGSGPDGEPRIKMGTDLGPDGDMLAVYRPADVKQNGNFFDGPALWRDMSAHGLALPGLPAVENLKRDLDEAEKGK